MKDDELFLKRDRMRFIKNSQASSLCYLGILFNVFYFVNIYKSDVGSYYYNYLIGISIVYNLVFMLAVFLSSEGVKNYQAGYAWVLIATGIGQIIRIFIIPMRAHATETIVNGQDVLVMHNGQFTRVLVYLVISAACLLLAAVVTLQKSRELNEHMKALDAQKA